MIDVEGIRSAAAGIVGTLVDEHGDWKIKGFVDVDKNVYTLTADTKVLSKALELVILPGLLSYFRKVGITVELADYQNQYPDITLVAGSSRLALDIKTTYVLANNPRRANGFTLGAFTGYFRNRRSLKNVKYSYGSYGKHLVLGLIYERNTTTELPKVFEMKRLKEILSAIKNIRCFLHEKWRVASDKPGSGNTKNIGSAKKVEDLIEGKSVFTYLGPRAGKRIFNDYWRNYLTKDMARAAELSGPLFTDLMGYLELRGYSGLVRKLLRTVG